MTNQNRINLNLLVLGIVILAGLLLILDPVSDRFSLLLIIVGGAVCFFVTGYSLYALGLSLRQMGKLFDGEAQTPPPAETSRWWVVIPAVLAAVLFAGLYFASDQPPVREFASVQLQVTLSLAILAALIQGGLDMEAERQRALAQARDAADAAAKAESDAEAADADAQKPKDAPAKSSEPQTPANPVNWLAKIAQAVINAFEALLMLIVKTLTTILPNSARLKSLDLEYNTRKKNELTKQAEALDLPETQKTILVDLWIEQINWASNRANRERDANEIIRWWQILLSASIPLITTLNQPVLGIQPTAWAGIAGAAVAVLTSLQQYRRPEERWRHYRIVTERYLVELWAFINLDTDIFVDDQGQSIFADDEDRYNKANYEKAFDIFNERMRAIQREELSAFFSQIFPPSRPSQQQTLPKDKA